MHNRRNSSRKNKKYCYSCKKWYGKHFFKPKQFIEKEIIFHFVCLICYLTIPSGYKDKILKKCLRNKKYLLKRRN